MAAAPYLQSTAAETPLVHAVAGNLTSGAPGPTVVLPVQVTNVQGLGAAAVLVDYNPASIKAVGCQRNVLFDIGVCNSAYDRNGDGTPDAVFSSEAPAGASVRIAALYGGAWRVACKSSGILRTL